MSSLVREYTQPYIKAPEVSSNANSKMAIVPNNLRKFAIALEIIELHGLAEEYRTKIKSAFAEHQQPEGSTKDYDFRQTNRQKKFFFDVGPI